MVITCFVLVLAATFVLEPPLTKFVCDECDTGAFDNKTGLIVHKKRQHGAEFQPQTDSQRLYFVLLAESLCAQRSTCATFAKHVSMTRGIWNPTCHRTVNH